MGLNCSKGDLGQIEEKPAGATGTGPRGVDGISFSWDLWEEALVSGMIHPQGLVLKEEGRQPSTSPTSAMASPPGTLLSSLQHPL